jgi:PAS domain-containing protein
MMLSPGLFLQHVPISLLSAINTLIPAGARAIERSIPAGETSSSVALSFGLAGSFCILWALWLQVQLRSLKRRIKRDLAAASLARDFKRALLAGAAQGAVVLAAGGREQQYYGEGRALYESSLASAKSGRVREVITDLTEHGTPFALSVPSGKGSLILRGVPVAGRAVLYFHRDGTCDDGERYREILESLPIPVWMRGADHGIAWANKSFLSVQGFASLENAVTADAMLQRSERELAARTLARGEPLSSKASLIVQGESRVFSLGLAPMASAGVAGFATDVTENARREAQLRLVCDAQDDVIDHFPFAVAVLDGERRLMSCNRAYAEMWDLPKPWLDKHPSYGEILDRLRDKRGLPEQRNFPEWKAAQMAAFDPGGRRGEEFWHLPNGKSIRIVIHSHLMGGVFILFEDITERLKLESSLTLLTQVQKATLDTLDDGIAIFGTDGRLVMHNVPFARMWKLSESELEGQPHFAEIANLCTDRIGYDGIWGLVSCGINSATPERFGEWSKTRRADGRAISLSLSRLPNGTTVVAFSDITDLEKFSTLDEDHAAA